MICPAAAERLYSGTDHHSANSQNQKRKPDQRENQERRSAPRGSGP